MTSTPSYRKLNILGRRKKEKKKEERERERQNSFVIKSMVTIIIKIII